jgi:DNA-directed RNA polymerase beta subunit
LHTLKPCKRPSYNCLYCQSQKCHEAVREDGSDEAIEPIMLPYVYHYLVDELAAMNVRLKVDVK